MVLPGSATTLGIEADVLEAVFQNVGEGVLVINRLRKVITTNTAASQITGWKQRDLTSINCNVFQTRNEQGKPTCADMCNVQRVIESGQTMGPDVPSHLTRRRQRRLRRGHLHSDACRGPFGSLRHAPEGHHRS